MEQELIRSFIHSLAHCLLSTQHAGSEPVRGDEARETRSLREPDPGAMFRGRLRGGPAFWAVVSLCPQQS